MMGEYSMKKRSLFVAFAALLLIVPLLGMGSIADTERYSLEEFGISISLPSDLYVFTRDVRSDDSELRPFGLDGEELAAFFEDNNIVLNAWDEDVNFEIVVTVTDEAPVESAQTFLALADTVKEELLWAYTDMGFVDVSSEIYRGEQFPFLKTQAADPASGQRLLQYYTIQNESGISIAMHVYDRALTAADQNMMRDVADSCTLLRQSDTKQSEPNRYYDADTGLSFQIPEAWVEEPSFEGDEYLDAQFISAFGAIAMYGSYDLWATIPIVEKEGLSRAEFSTEQFSDDELIEMLGVSGFDAVIDNRNGVRYLVLTQQAESMGITVTITQFAYIKNGMMYFFQFSGWPGDEGYDDFLTMIDSARYPGTASDGQPDAPYLPFYTPSSASQRDDLWDDFGAGELILSLLMTVAIYSLPVCVYRYAIRRRPMEAKKARIFTIVYAVIGFVCMGLLIGYISDGAATVTGGGIFLWSWVNYKMLTGGRDAAPEQGDGTAAYPPDDPRKAGGETQPQGQVLPQNEPEQCACRKCGEILLPDDTFCRSCGTRRE